MSKEKGLRLHERHQLILADMLRSEEENKYCADCHAKGQFSIRVVTCLLWDLGPRWASWNLGIFICIRCAGIHRNLGVHISRVKSVNLDSWTPEQIQVSNVTWRILEVMWLPCHSLSKEKGMDMLKIYMKLHYLLVLKDLKTISKTMVMWLSHDMTF